VTVFIVALLSLWRDYKFRQLESSGELHLTALLRPLVLMVKIIVVVVAMLAWAKNAGFNISTLIAGLGVGSLAIALAAQRTMENIIGAVTIYAARPIRPGDFCRFGDLRGTVEEIGLRSVTVRTLDRTRVFIPNAKFAADQVENISVRDRIRFLKYLQLQMPTSEQLRVILGELREMLSAHPKVQPGTISVRLVDIEAATAVFKVDAGVMTADYQTYLAIAEDLNLRIIEIVHDNGAIFSGPGQVLQVRDFHKASDETMSEVTAKLDDWRANEQLPFPDLSEERKAEVEASLIYPPTGSPKQ
jgi:MscS family membrane protein